MPILAGFGICKIPCAEVWKFFAGVRMRTLIHVYYFKSIQNRRRVSGQKSTLYWFKTRFVILRCNFWADFQCIFVWMHTVTPHIYSGFHLDPFRLGGDITEKTHPGAPRVNSVFWVYLKRLLHCVRCRCQESTDANVLIVRRWMDGIWQSIQECLSGYLMSNPSLFYTPVRTNCLYLWTFLRVKWMKHRNGKHVIHAEEMYKEVLLYCTQ